MVGDQNLRKRPTQAPPPHALIRPARNSASVTKDEAPSRREQPANESEEVIEPSHPSSGVPRVIEAAIQSSVLHSGPLPPPEMLAQYEKILPGLADRIMAEAERQTAHRQAAEMTVIRNDARQSMVGMAAGVVTVLAALAVAAVFVLQGQPWFGIVALLAPITTLAGVFVHGNNSRRKERTSRLEETLNPAVDADEPPRDQPSEPRLPRE